VYVCDPRAGEDDTCKQLAVSTLANTMDRVYRTYDAKFLFDHGGYYLQ